MAVITTACWWCIIMPCMKSISASEGRGTMPVVLEGKFLLGVPGAPGSTTGADPGPVCWEIAEAFKAKHSNPVARQPLPDNGKRFKRI